MSAPRPELLALLDAIKDNPDEDTPRLVLADWLDEQDNGLDARRAAFVRAHIAHVRGAGAAEKFSGLKAAPRLFGALAPVATGLDFERGLPVARVPGERLGTAGFVRLLPTEDFAFVQVVQVSGSGGPSTEAAVAQPAFRHVAGLVLYPFSSFGVASAARVFGSPHLSGLRHLTLNHVRPGVVGTEALAGNPALGRLRKLFLPYNALADKAVVALAASPHLTKLQTLALNNNNFGDKVAEALAGSAALGGLRALDVTGNPRLTARGKAALRKAFGDRVRLDP